MLKNQRLDLTDFYLISIFDYSVSKISVKQYQTYCNLFENFV
ncbi:hypothetical protein STRMA_1268 [Streptococcus macacae NCTC 11558]|uniref:Uncharacterized protein n=1 Tax=Streptococcus macacae NCTC 11558 TaxID=764298 RepID=G5JXB3_9STRE|nr:hypothetical protein STRMA_1268 [Streptococcus macacae NCTC 11558]